MSRSPAAAIDVRGCPECGQALRRNGALKRISLSIRDNGFFTLLGPSGCGKTTLLRMIAGFEDVTEGKILLFGERIAGLPPNRHPVNTKSRTMRCSRT